MTYWLAQLSAVLFVGAAWYFYGVDALTLIAGSIFLGVLSWTFYALRGPDGR